MSRNHNKLKAMVLIPRTTKLSSRCAPIANTNATATDTVVTALQIKI